MEVPHDLPAEPNEDFAEPYEVLTAGRCGVDLYPLQTGVPLAEVSTFGKFLGGSPTNVAVAAARLGRRTAVITRTGPDPFGTFVRKALRGFGVDDRFVRDVAGLQTPVTFCEIFPPDDFPLYFYRRPTAPDLQIRAAELDLDAVRVAGVFWATGTGLCEEPSRSATLAALAARSRTRHTVLDLDWRPMFWGEGAEGTEGPGPGAGAGAGAGGGPAQARALYAEALTHVTVAVGNTAEAEVATGLTEPHAAAHALVAAGPELAVVKRGGDGVLAVHRDGTEVTVPALPVKVLNGLGAGDAFGGALCHGLLAGWDLESTLRYANAAGAMVAGRLECSSAMPYPQEVEDTLAAGEVR